MSKPRARVIDRNKNPFAAAEEPEAPQEFRLTRPAMDYFTVQVFSAQDELQALLIRAGSLNLTLHSILPRQGSGNLICVFERPAEDLAAFQQTLKELLAQAEDV